MISKIDKTFVFVAVLMALLGVAFVIFFAGAGCQPQTVIVERFPTRESAPEISTSLPRGYNVYEWRSGDVRCFLVEHKDSVGYVNAIGWSCVR